MAIIFHRNDYTTHFADSSANQLLRITVVRMICFSAYSGSDVICISAGSKERQEVGLFVGGC